MPESPERLQSEEICASGDSHDVGASADRFTVRDMADALMEIYIASEREREGEREKDTEEAL